MQEPEEAYWELQEEAMEKAYYNDLFSDECSDSVIPSYDDDDDDLPF